MPVFFIYQLSPSCTFDFWGFFVIVASMSKVCIILHPENHGISMRLRACSNKHLLSLSCVIKMMHVIMSSSLFLSLKCV